MIQTVQSASLKTAEKNNSIAGKPIWTIHRLIFLGSRSMAGSTYKNSKSFTVAKVKIEFDYAETKSSNSGAGPRGIWISRKGVAGKSQYAISPNPHDDSKNYPKKASNFYDTLADGLIKEYFAGETGFPKTLKVKWKNTQYTLS